VNQLLKQNGFELVPHVLDERDCQELIVSLGPVNGAGRRGLLDVSIVAKLATSVRLLDLVRPHLKSEPRAVRAIYFDKSAGINWLVAWHQDLTISVRRRVDVPGFGPWSTKDGVPHVQPPIELLEQMLTVRLHLDDCDETNGALRIIPASHSFGRLSAERIIQLRQKNSEFVCCASAGDALLMFPLLLHASNRSRSTHRRRILHIEFALLPELEWNQAMAGVSQIWRLSSGRVEIPLHSNIR
jgi:hypothetical protein